MCVSSVFINLPGSGGGKREPGLPAEASFYGHRLLTNPSQACANLLLTQFITWRQGRVEKLEPEAGQEPELPRASFPSPFPHPALLWANVLSPFHILGVIHPVTPSQHGSYV